MYGHPRGMEGPSTSNWAAQCPMQYRDTSPQTSQAPDRDTMGSALPFKLPQAYLPWVFVPILASPPWPNPSYLRTLLYYPMLPQVPIFGTVPPNSCPQTLPPTYCATS